MAIKEAKQEPDQPPMLSQPRNEEARGMAAISRRNRLGLSVARKRPAPGRPRRPMAPEPGLGRQKLPLAV